MESDGMLVDGSNYELSIKFGNFPYHAIWSLKHKVEAGCTSITGDVHYGSMTAEEAQRYPVQMALNT
ncbi:hypothetical protein LY78DRAFT_681250 [Colletotrichum sublineola]|nr:hypothetical protein LY78DRAFT_681250 [Colletotrichum sublineola]